MRAREYESLKTGLQIELLKVQRWAKESGERIVILFEGRDAAGKGRQRVRGGISKCKLQNENSICILQFAICHD